MFDYFEDEEYDWSEVLWVYSKVKKCWLKLKSGPPRAGMTRNC
jgi:hypothetical protein